MIMQAMKTQCKETNLCGVCLHFLCIVTIDHHRILNDKPCVERRHRLKVKSSVFFFTKLNFVLFAQCIIFCRTNRAHWRSVIDSQLFMIKNKPTNSQRSKMTYLEDNFAISPDFLHFPTFSYIKSSSFYRRGNFFFGSSHCSWEHLANYSPPFWVNLEFPHVKRVSFLFVCFVLFKFLN